jgi:hypothetical protein
MPEAAKAALWREMKAQIGGKNPGSLVGKWVKDYGLPAITDAHFAAMASPPADYVEWMVGRLKAMATPYNARGSPANGHGSRTRRGSVMESLRTNLNLMDDPDDAGEPKTLSGLPQPFALVL